MLPACLQHYPLGIRPFFTLARRSDPKKSTFKIILYRQHSRSNSRGLVRGGDALRMIHRELDAYMGTSIPRAKALQSICMLNESAQVSRASATIFIIEKADCRDGSPCRWDETFRLRHVPSGMFLICGTPADHPEQKMGSRRLSFFSATRTLMNELGTQGQFQYKDRLRVLLTSNRDSPHTLFQLYPQYAANNVSAPPQLENGRKGSFSSEGVIGVGQIFGVRHVSSKLWLHHEQSSSPAVHRPNAAAERTTPQPSEAKGRWAGIKNVLTSHHLVEQGTGHADTLGKIASYLCATRDRHDEDMLTFRQVPAYQYHDTLYIRSRVKLLEDVSGKFVEGLETETLWPLMQRAAAVLTELIIFVTESDNTDPFSREGLPIASRQLLSTELQLFDLVIAASAKFSKYAQSLSSSGSNESFDLLTTERHTMHGSFGGDSRKSGADNETGAKLRRQTMLRRQATGLLAAAAAAGESQAKKSRGGGTVPEQCTRLAMLCQRLARHTLRGHAQNKKYGMRFVPELQTLLGKGIQAADTLREVFTDNAEVLDMVTDDMIRMFVRLIRTTGRQARFVEFLRVLCMNNGKAIRKNQWRVCRFFINEAPELHVKLSIQNAGTDQQRVVVSGDAQYFPAFVGSSELEVCRWLDTTSPETAAYFERCVALYEVLVQGRNLKNTPVMQALLPYSVITELVTNTNLHEKHLLVSAQFATVARALYVDTEPHQTMCRVRSIRVWDNIHTAAMSGKLSSRLVTTLKIDWSMFDELKSFIAEYLRSFAVGQWATHLAENCMSLELIKLLYHLIECGFYRSDEVARLLPVLLDSLDGRRDIVGGMHDDDSARYKQVKTIRMDTVVIMECKLWLCKILQLVVTMRLDIRLSLLLDIYQTAWQSGKYTVEGGAAAAKGRTSVVSSMITNLATDVSTGLKAVRRKSLGYLQFDVDEQAERREIFDVLRMDADSNVDLVHVLLDLTFYEHSELTTAAMGLLVRHFEQRSVLIKVARETRLLVKQEMIENQMKFDDLLRKLGAFAKRRRLFDDEPYQAVRLMSILAMHCYEESIESGAGRASNHSGSRASTRSREMGSSVAGRSFAANSRHAGSINDQRSVDGQSHVGGQSQATHSTLTESQQSTYVHLVGKGVVVKGESALTVSKLEHGERMLRRGDRIEIENVIYKVRAVDVATKLVTVDRKIDILSFGMYRQGTAPVSAENSSNGGPTPEASFTNGSSFGAASAKPAGGASALETALKQAVKEHDQEQAATTNSPLRPGSPDDGYTKEKIVWIYLESSASHQNADVQSLLYQMGAHDIAMKFLSLPFVTETILGEDLHIRAVASACYRLLRSMTVHFPLMQKALVPHLPSFLAHTEARLVASDITPTECITSVYKDNRIVCTQVGEDTVRHFVRLAAHEQAPRYLRFLGMITLPSGQPARRCQTLVLQCLLEKEEVLQLYNGEDGMEKRSQLIANNDHVDNPRGELAYHIELITLFARCIEGSPPIPVMQLEAVMPLGELMNHLLQDQLPHSLKRAYLAILDGLYLAGDKTNNPLQSDETREDLLMLLDALLASIDRFVEDIAPVASFEDYDEVSEANFIFRSVLMSVRLFYTNIFTRSAFGTSLDVFSRSLAHALLLLGQCSDAQPDVMSASAVAECLDAIHSTGSGLISRDDVSVDAANRQSLDKEDSVNSKRGGGGGWFGTGRVTEMVPVSSGGGDSSESFSRKTRRMPPRDPNLRTTVVQAGNVSMLSNAGPQKAAIHPQERLLAFIDEIETSLADDLEAEQKGLIAVFMNGGDNREGGSKDRTKNRMTQARRSIGSRLDMNSKNVRNKKQITMVRRSSIVQLAESNFVTYTKNLIYQLSRSPVRRGHGREQLSDLEVSQTSAGLKVLITMIHQQNDVEVRSRQQQLLTLLGAPTVALVMASCEHDELCLGGIQLGIALLLGGNKDVQAAMFKALTEEGVEDHIRPFDGSSHTFLSMLRMRLRLAMREITERKTFYDVQEEMRDLISEEYSTASSSTLAQLQKEIDKEFPSRSHVLEVLEMMRLLCEGHNNAMQDLMHVQSSSISNIDLVGEVYELLAKLEPEIDESNVLQMQRCVDTLVEFVQGNTSNQIVRFLMDTKLLEILDRLIQKQSMPYVESQELLDLQLAVALLLLALLEGKVHAEIRMLSVLDVRRLAEVAGALYERAQGEDIVESERNSMLDVGSRVYMLVSHLLDYHEQNAERMPVHGRAYGLERMRILYNPEVDLSYYQRFIARVELINASGRIEYAYFRFPAFCLLLTEESKQRLLWSVDRSTPGRQIQDFFDHAQDLHLEMRHQERLNESRAWRLLTYNKSFALNAMFSIAIVQNFLILLVEALSDAPQIDISKWSEQTTIQDIYALGATLLGVGQATACVVVFLIHAMQEGPLRVRQRRREATGMTSAEVQTRMVNDFCFAVQYYAMIPYDLLTDATLLFYILAFIAAVLGITHSPLFYSFHLLDMVNKSQDLQSVFLAVTRNGRSILMTALFGFVVIYLYAIIGFAYGQDLFMAGDYPDGSATNEFDLHPDESMCRNLYVCWVSAVVKGLQDGDIGKIMEPRYSNDERYGFIIIYQFTYYIFVITVLLNVIFGIIIDTFGQLRTERATKRASMENACFICGVDRFTFDTQGGGFKRHIDHDHNMWHYLFMIVYLREKDSTEYNGWEQYVADKMNERDTSFFPLNNAIVLREHKERQEKGSQQLLDSVRDMNLTISNLSRHLERVETQVNDKVSSLANSQRSLEQALHMTFSQQAGSGAHAQAAAGRAARSGHGENRLLERLSFSTDPPDEIRR